MTKTKNPTEDYYDLLAKDYDQIWPKAEYSIPRWLKSFFGNYEKTNARIMDLGCGSGIVGDILKELNFKPNFLLGVDLSEQMVIEARKKGLYNEVLKQDLSTGLKDKKSHSYDVVTACGLFEFIQDKDKLLNDISYQLNKGGTLLATFESCTDSEEKASIVQSPSGPITRHRITESELTDLIEKCGLQVVHIEKTIGYKSPSTGNTINYFLLESKKPT